MSLRAEKDENKLALYAKRKAEWWSYRRRGLSSEDVWEARECVSSALYIIALPDDEERTASRGRRSKRVGRVLMFR